MSSSLIRQLAHAALERVAESDLSSRRLARAAGLRSEHVILKVKDGWRDPPLSTLLKLAHLAEALDAGVASDKEAA